MSRWQGARWWLVALCALPLAVPLALHARSRALRLAPAAGPSCGLAGADLPGEALRLLVLGESTVAGVGSSCLQQALVGYLADELAVRHGRPVRWRACGENGITAEQACGRLLPRALEEPVDLALLVFGVNDTTRLTALGRWQGALTCMADALSARGARVAFSAVPPLQHFTALPWLVRRLFGGRARLLDERLQQVAHASGVTYCAVGLVFSADFLALDGYHPSSLGYRVWARELAQVLSPTPNHRAA